MKLQGRRKSVNVEDRRGTSINVGGRRGIAPGGIIGGGIGGVIIVVVVLIISFCSGGDPSEILNDTLLTDSTAGSADSTYQATREEDDLAEFVSIVLAETEDVWTEIFAKEGMDYYYPGLVLYTEYVESACGIAGAAVGPFYCPGDQKVYIDLSFYSELQYKYQAPGDFAMAYIIAHEVGHHIQNILGIIDDVNSVQASVSQAEANEYSVRLELQADYLAGVWAHYVDRMNLLEDGDLEEALNAASAVGDDKIQKQYQGYVVPDSFTHGTSEQRQRWFFKGFKSGTLEEGDTFNTDDL